MTVTFDGHSIDALFIVGDPKITIFDSQVNYADSENRDGQIVVGRHWGSAKVSFTIAATGTAATRRAALSTLGSYLAVDSPRKLVLPDTSWYYMAIPDGSLNLERAINGEYTELSFTLVDPIGYGDEVTVTVPSGGSVTFTVGGTAPTKPNISATAVRDSSALVWGLKLDNADFVHIATGNAAGRVVKIDCDERTATVSGNTSMITLDSDWLELSPGSHTLVMDKGTGAATVKYRERWY